MAANKQTKDNQNLQTDEGDLSYTKKERIGFTSAEPSPEILRLFVNISKYTVDNAFQ